MKWHNGRIEMRYKLFLASVAIALAGCHTDKSVLVGIYSLLKEGE